MPYSGNDVIPSFLGIAAPTQFHSDGGVNDNTLLRVGEVRDVLYPNDPNNRSKQFTEYNVFVQHWSNGTAVAKLYNNCQLINTFGGLTDKCVWTLRPNLKVDGTQTKVGLGSKVIILCVSGQSMNPLILGGIRDQNDKADADFTGKDPGHYFLWNFNGIEVDVNDKGELLLTYKGKTESDGKLNKDVDENAVGTFVNIKENGNLELATVGGNQSLTLDHDQKTIETIANTGWNVQVKDGNSTIKSKGLLIGEATDKMLLASTYRQAEQELHAQLVTALTTVQTLAGVAAGAATGPLTIPMVGGSIAGPIIGASLIAIATQVGNALAAIQKFEAQAAQYISERNRND